MTTLEGRPQYIIVVSIDLGHTLSVDLILIKYFILNAGHRFN